MFLTDRENITLSRFSGTFSFFPDDQYKLGTVDPTFAGIDSVCNFEIRASKIPEGRSGYFGGRKTSKEGSIMTPTYPGTYPKNLKCSYKFIGKYPKINQESKLNYKLKYKYICTMQ